MKKNTKWIAIVIALLCLIVLGTWSWTSKQEEGEKTIFIDVLIDGNKQSFILKSDALTLRELLEEETSLQAVMEDSTYGALLTSLLGHEQDMDKGPWWLFSSDNNKDCVAQNMCPVLDQVNLSDQDAFLFELTSDF